MSDLSGTALAEGVASVAVASVAFASPVVPRSVLVRRYIAEVETALQTQTPAQVSANFADFQKEFPKIFEIVLTRTYRKDIMAVLLDNLDRMERGSRSQHDASVAVGTVLVERIVKPQLKKK
jgi:hypothetical protein